MSVQHPWFKNALHTDYQALLNPQEAGFVFAASSGVISTKNILKQIGFSTDIHLKHDQQMQQWVDRCISELAQQKKHNTVLVGGFPFSHRDVPELFLAEAHNTHLSSRYDDRRHLAFFGQQLPATLVPSAEHYKFGVQAILDQMQAGTLRKAVLARAIELKPEHAVDVAQLFDNLLQDNPEGYTFALSQNPQQHGWFVGASPELLVAKQHAQVFSHPVAGTLARHADNAEDQARAQQLLASQKDHYEHAMVIEAIADQLAPFCSQLHVPAKPSLIKTKTLWHLATPIHGTLKDADTHVLKLVELLHPTPAVCGQPPQLARNMIDELEPFQRSLFTGAMGWSDTQGNGAWSVTIRCARVFEDLIRIYAGAGIVPESRPELELAETAAKFRTMLDALGLQPEDLLYQA